MLDDAEKRAVLESWRLVGPIADAAAGLFYQRLFELAPQHRPLFEEDLDARRELVAMLSFVVGSMDWRDDDWQQDVDPAQDLCFVVLALGRRHVGLLSDEAWVPVGAALSWTLDQSLGQSFTPEMRAAWTKLYELVATAVKVGARAARIETRLGEVA